MPLWRDQQLQLEHAWQLVQGWCTLGSPSSQAQLDEFQQASSLRLPLELRELLLRHNGLTIVDNTFIDPLPNPKSPDYHSWLAEIYRGPAWLQPFGNDGSDSAFCFCTLDPDSETAPVLDVQEYSWQPHTIEIAARSVTELLMIRTAFYLLLYADAWTSDIPHVRARGDLVSRANWHAALETLGLPREYFRFADDRETDFFPLIREWMWTEFPGPETQDWSLDRWVGHLRFLKPD